MGNELSKVIPQENGICQGLSISCTIFLIAINDIVSSLHPEVQCAAYADDVTLLMRSKDMTKIQFCLQSSLNNLNTWSTDAGFLFSPEKCQAIHFCRKTKPHPNPNLSLSDNPLMFVDNLKILGLYFDRKLTFKLHLKQIKSECLKRLNFIKVLSGTRWGCNKSSLLLLYGGFIQSKLDYASPFTAHLKLIISRHWTPYITLDSNKP